MAITYDAGNNIITIVAYTEASPCTFLDIYNADKAGILSLHARTGITAADTDPVAVDRAERPADYVVLGRTSNDLYITIANWSGTTATIRITGTDRDGAAQTEDIVVTANGDYYTTKWFKTITQTQVTAFTGTSFDYDLTQGQWGVVWNQGTNQFTFDAEIYVGDGSTVTYLADENVFVTFSNFTPASTYGFIGVTDNAYIRFGKLIGGHRTEKGCSFRMLLSTRDYQTLIGGKPATGEPRGNVELYSCLMIGGKTTHPGNLVLQAIKNATVYNCVLNGIGLYNLDNPDLYQVIVGGSPWGLADMVGSSSIIDECTFNNITGDWGAVHANPAKAPNATVRNVDIAGSTWDFGLHNHSAYGAGPFNMYAINTTVDRAWHIKWIYTADNMVLYRQYEFDLKVIDKDGNNVDGATVKIWDKDGTLVVDTTTTGGVIATQTLNYGYYRYPTGDTPTMQTPHLIKIEKSGYTTYEADFTLEEKTDWTIALQGVLKRNPAMTGGMV